MSQLKRLRKKVGYELDVPRCGNCRDYCQARSWLKDSLPQKGQHFCRQHHFSVHPNAVCDDWFDSKNGVPLETPNVGVEPPYSVGSND